MTKTAEYTAWFSMKARCNNSAHRYFADYGGRGIKVCKRWERSFENFLRDMGPRPKGMTLERIDVNLGYTPSNCKWATWGEQANNKRSSRFIEHLGMRLTVAQWAQRLGIGKDTLGRRLESGMRIERALTAGLLRKSA